MIRIQRLRTFPSPTSLWIPCQVLSKAYGAVCFCSLSHPAPGLWVGAAGLSRGSSCQTHVLDLPPSCCICINALPLLFGQLLIFMAQFTCVISLGWPTLPFKPSESTPTCSQSSLCKLSATLIVVYNTWFIPHLDVSPSWAGPCPSCSLLYP